MTAPWTGKRGAETPAWKGGRTITSDGCVAVRVGKEHHLAAKSGYALEHRLVAEQLIGRRLLPTDRIYHKDGNKLNNAPANLIVSARILGHRGEQNGRWRGGRKRHGRGYVSVQLEVGNHLARKEGYAFEHRVVAEKALGRHLLKEEVVHHLDGDRANNEPSNLVVCRNQAEHRRRFHHG